MYKCVELSEFTKPSSNTGLLRNKNLMQPNEKQPSIQYNTQATVNCVTLDDTIHGRKSKENTQLEKCPKKVKSANQHIPFWRFVAP